VGGFAMRNTAILLCMLAPTFFAVTSTAFAKPIEQDVTSFNDCVYSTIRKIDDDVSSADLIAREAVRDCFAYEAVINGNVDNYGFVAGKKLNRKDISSGELYSRAVLNWRRSKAPALALIQKYGSTALLRAQTKTKEYETTKIQGLAGDWNQIALRIQQLENPIPTEAVTRLPTIQ
jgi:hypothetical protein